MIQIEKINKFYGKTQALKDVSLNIAENRVLAIIGPNGSGKSTLIKILTGLLKDYDGNVKFVNPDLANINLASEEFGFPGYYTVGSIIRLFTAVKTDDKSNEDHIVELMGLQNLSKKKISTLSQGQKQRLNIACALIGAGKTIILDEPNNGLDPDGFILLRELIEELKHRGHTIIVASHLLNEVENFAEDVVFIKEGCVILSQNMEGILRDYNSLEEAYISLS
ncbi:MAG: ABC transporter ATP-binding protein [Cyclobacteriaceae bacterium]